MGMIAPEPRQGRTQSTASGADFGWDKPAVVAKSGNAMLFAVPAKVGTMDAGSLIAVSDIPGFMKDLKKAVAPRPPQRRGGMRGGLLSADSKSMPIVVHGFDKGTYDVVIAPSAASIAMVIAQVSEAKRPTVNDQLYSELDSLYPGWTFVLFCFSEQDAEQAGCALIKYEPQREDLLYLPGLDGHAGVIEWGAVDIAHTVVVSSDQLKDGPNVNQVVYSDQDVAKHPYLFTRVLGKVVSGRAPQGDFLCQIADIRKGEFRCKRALPPGTPASVKLERGEPHYI
ncbi:MAG: hypothetical protein KGS72_22450 [Cyanobacteria bacterium REEB67]|nr:hypothetical protein [Cyanobacteria bacterium REEB67]